VLASARALRRAGSFCKQNSLPPFAFTPWLRLGYSALLRVHVALPVSFGLPSGHRLRRTGIQPFSDVFNVVAVHPPPPAFQRLLWPLGGR
jgi:hypothetical protein